jgi:hypothetical protein
MASETTDEFDADASRRRLLKGAVLGAGALWVAPTIDSFFSPAAAASGSATNVSLHKDANGTLGTRCVAGCNGNVGGGQNQCSPAGRGSVDFVRTVGSPDTICATITMSTGTVIAGRAVHISMSDGTTCISQPLAGTWATPAAGPQTFCLPVASGATWFSVHLPVSGGGGNDIYTSLAVNLP